MRWVLGIGALLIGLLAATAESSPPTRLRLSRVELFGTEYVALDDWARANGYQVSWPLPKREVRLTHPNGKLEFTIDSRKMTLRGVVVWLSHAIAGKDGRAYISSRDLATAVHPILFPRRQSSTRKIRSIVLDPGHGGKDPGNQEGSRREKDYTLLLAREVAEILRRAGIAVKMTRDRDTFVELPSRPQVANRGNADLFLSLHFNSADGSGSPAVKGAEVFCMTPVRASSTNARGEGAGAGAFPGNRFDQKNVLLGYQIQKALSTKAGMEDRGLKRARFAVLRDATMPAVLIEAGFMTSPTDSRRIYDSQQRKRLAQSVADGILEYRRLIERQ
ncbi:MAG TPA: N-acetylmuramoyl-L-alanine amidase [Verrucomicrobiae bacterium]|nr:N-acetylmuramoyl-L-alanine amidase [Verrucomicrobiae bacterium]